MTARLPHFDSKWLPLAVAGIAIPSSAHALPTPDLVVGMINLVPWVVGGAVALAGAAYALLGRLLGRRVGDFASGALLGVLVVLVAGIAWWTGTRIDQERDRKVRNLATYLRCDFSGHEYYQDMHEDRMARNQAWDQVARFEWIFMDDVAERLRQNPDAALFATYETEIAYHSGIPAVDIDGELKPFESARRSDLADRLLESNAAHLYLIGSDFYNQRVDLFPGLSEALSKFQRVYLVLEVSRSQRYTRTFEGDLEPVITEQRVRWPVRRESWIVDESRVRFPGMTTLLEDHDVARQLKDPNVMVVVPYSSMWRNAIVYQKDYLTKLLSDVDSTRVLAIDMNARGVDRQLEAHARRLDGKRFMVVGVTKYDWVYSGIDHAFAMWERLSHDPNRFHLLGFSTRLPEAVAINWIEDRERSGMEPIAAGFWSVIGWLDERWDIAVGTAVLLFAIALRLLLFPIGFLETRSRMLRARIDQRVKAANPPGWQGAAAALKRLLGVRRGWELAGAVVTLALIVPAYRVLADPESHLLYQPFLWIHSLNERDVALGLIVATLVFVKLSTGGAGPRWLPVAGTLIFIPVLITIPSAVLVYVLGVLAATIVQDLLARRSATVALDRALMTT